MNYGLPTQGWDGFFLGVNAFESMKLVIIVIFLILFISFFKNMKNVGE